MARQESVASLEVVYGFHLMRAFVQGDANHVIPPTVLEALNEAGVFRLLTPKRYGGHETDLRTLPAVSETLAWQTARQPETE